MNDEQRNFMTAIIGIINAFLWRLGGAGVPPLGKNLRRICYPMIMMLVFIWSVPPTKLLFFLIVCHLTTRFPLTLIGDDINKHWFNWIWIWILGYILGLPSALLHGWSGLLCALIPAVGQGISVTLSNIPRFRNIFTHEFCEGIIGFSVALAIVK